MIWSVIEVWLLGFSYFMVRRKKGHRKTRGSGRRVGDVWVERSRKCFSNKLPLSNVNLQDTSLPGYRRGVARGRGDWLSRQWEITVKDIDIDTKCATVAHSSKSVVPIHGLEFALRQLGPTLGKGGSLSTIHTFHKCCNT